jgi:glycerol-3-phosphate acyltransferase PlsX
MQERLVISIDAMGGANAPLCVIDALESFCSTNKSVNFLIFGNQSQLEPLLDSRPSLKDRYTIHHTNDVISDHEQPVRALKIGKNSSMYLAIQALKEGKANACLSSGNTGALMVMTKMILGSLKGIKRPAIVSLYPNQHGGTVILDLGANSQCDPQHLFEFAIMGSCFAKVVQHKDTPTIGVLNIGTEEYKGRELDKKTHELLKNSDLNYHGFVEPHDLAKGTVDVVVTDGFTGNVALKSSEGTAKVIKEFMKIAFHSNLRSKIGGWLAKKSLQIAFQDVDPRKYNGAMFIGVDGIVVKSHGSSDSIAFEYAINRVVELTEKQINKQISALLQHEKELENAESIVSKIKTKLGF